jgi:DNA-binding IclR family transcriptional regulator
MTIGNTLRHRTTAQQDRIIIALTRDHLPRTVKNLSVETHTPVASVRRILSDLRSKGYLWATAEAA